MGNGVTTAYTYRQDNRRLDALQAQLPNVTHYRFQNLAYRYDNVGNILGISNNSLMPEGQKDIGEEVGGPVTQTLVYDDLYRLTQASGEYRHETGHLQRYRLGMAYDSIHNITSKEQLHEKVETKHGKTDVDVEHDTSYTYGYTYGYHYAAPQTGSSVGAIHPHAPSDIGPYANQYDSNGNLIDRRYRDDDGTRQIVWDEDNRMVCVHNFEHDHPQHVIAQIPASCQSTSSNSGKDGHNSHDGSHMPEVRFVYNDRGERVLKEGHENVSFYLNPHYTEKSDGAYKHILIGTTRLVTKEVEDEKKEYEDDQYYYHPDHLGSSSFVTDHEGKLEEHLEYFPFGETWIEEESSLPIAFQFTAKELDSETGLYYFGARYYDPRTSVWQSADPILDKYLPSGDKEKDKNLPGQGGVYRPININLYRYASQNPLVVVDPDGRIDCPVNPNTYQMSSPVQPARHLFGKVSHHDGTDMAVPKLTDVRALTDGKVINVSTQRGYGKIAIVSHGEAKAGEYKGKFVATMYAHNTYTDPLVKVGDRVVEGEPIALSGNTGRGTGSGLHTHYEIRVFDKEPKSFGDFMGGKVLKPGDFRDMGLDNMKWSQKDMVPKD